MRIPIIFILFIALSVTSYSQEPLIGWDSLKSLIVYPDLARRAGLEGFVDVQFNVDTNGNASKIIVTASHEQFYSCVKEVVKNVKWNCRTFEGRRIEQVIQFPIHFMLLHNDKSRIIIRSASPKARIVY
jgi:TonB family protein